MPSRDQAPEMTQWLARMRELAVLCQRAEASGARELLLQVEAAVRGCPREVSSWFAPTHGKGESARLILAGGGLSFVLGLCSSQMSYLLSRSVTGQSFVTVALPELEQEASFSSPDLTVAVAGALLTLTLGCMDGQLARSGPGKWPIN